MKAKKVLALALVLALAMTLLPTAAAAESDFTIEHGVLVKYTGLGGDVVIPQGVTAIGDYAFLCCTGLTSVTIPKGVTTIGEQAFFECESLTSVAIPEGVTTIGKSAFERCTALRNITIPESATAIGEYAFWYCDSLTSIFVDAGNKKYASRDGVLFSKDMTQLLRYPGGKQGAYTIPESVTSVETVAFDSCVGLTSVTISGGTTSFKGRPFDGCGNLTSIFVDAGNEWYASRDGVLFSKDMTQLIRYPEGKQGAYVIPAGVSDIGGTFFDCDSLTAVTIPASVTDITNGTFSYCDSLTSISVDAGNKEYISQDGVLFSKDMHTLTTYPGGKQGVYTIPASVTIIGETAFQGCAGLTGITIPAGVTTIGYLAFSHCTGLTAVTIPAGVITIGGNAFWECTGLTDITIPTSVTIIGASAFSWCESLTSVTIPEGVTTIGDRAFYACRKLKTVKVYSKTADFGNWEFFYAWFSPELTFYGYAGSTAETFCKENNIPFDLLENAPSDPSPSPSAQPSTKPSTAPSAKPSEQPSTTPSSKPSTEPSAKPSTTPSAKPSTAPSSKPSESPKPSAAPVAVAGVSVAKTASVQVGKAKTLTATVRPSNAANKSVYWTSDDTYVVSVDTDGKITGVKEGAANVTVTTVDGGFTATCAVTVTKASTPSGGGGGGAAGGGGGGGGTAKPSAAPSAQPSQKPIDTSKPASENFSDVVKDSWYESGVTYVVQKGLFQGVADRTFAPQQNMTRAMLVTVLARLDGQSTEGGATWYAKGTDWAKAQGVSDGTMLDQSVTREQMVTMLYRYAKAKAGAADLSQFADADKVSAWAREAMAWAVEKGILTGKDGNRLDPQGTATRAEVATILQRFVEKT